MSTPATPPPRSSRRTAPAARGEPYIWVIGTALVLCVGMIFALLGVVAWGGGKAFWPRPIERVALKGGGFFLGVPVREESIDPQAGSELRRLYYVGNRELTGATFRWVDLADIDSLATPADALLLERREWGAFIGEPEAVLLERELSIPSPVAESGEVSTPWGVKPAVRRVLSQAPDAQGAVRVRETVTLARGPAVSRAMLAEVMPGVRDLRDQIRGLKRDEIGSINHRREEARLALRKVELDVEEGRASPGALAEARRVHEEETTRLDAQFAALRGRIAELEAEMGQYRFVIRDPALGRFAPRSQSEPGEPLPIAQIVRVVPANELSWTGKLGVYVDRWREFLTEEPREANTEGGVLPVIFGTVAMTLLLCVLVVPLGVIAALYLREYAKQGLAVNVVRIAVNNLAGVPSIVYGVFGLGFFCYTLGRYIDAGPEHPAGTGVWGLGVGAWCLLIALTALAYTAGRPAPGQTPAARHRWMRRGFALGCGGILVLGVWLVATTPYFRGFFRPQLPNATFGTKGLLWAAFTLALMTLPVVIVATEEAISAVPRSLREGSYGCGASKWQTVRRIVLPRAAPGIMTGMILAMARGAGEVAPLMLVGAVKLAPDLPFEARFPYFFPQRSFMHLGFHIYDLGFQSPDSEASRPLVWTTTMLLILLVVVLNLSAILIRARLRRRFLSSAF